jgi:hypothetical protein
MPHPTQAYVIKTAIPNPAAPAFTFPAQKTMYGGKHIAPGATIFLFASETQGGPGLVARGIVTSAAPAPKIPGRDRQPPRVTIAVAGVEPAATPLGRADLKPFNRWADGQPQTELNFKLYRQATNKIAGITPATAAFLHRHFPATP